MPELVLGERAAAAAAELPADSAEQPAMVEVGVPELLALEGARAQEGPARPAGAQERVRRDGGGAVAGLGERRPVWREPRVGVPPRLDDDRGGEWPGPARQPRELRGEGLELGARGDGAEAADRLGAVPGRELHQGEVDASGLTVLGDGGGLLEQGARGAVLPQLVQADALQEGDRCVGPPLARLAEGEHGTAQVADSHPGEPGGEGPLGSRLAPAKPHQGEPGGFVPRVVSEGRLVGDDRGRLRAALGSASPTARYAAAAVASP